MREILNKIGKSIAEDFDNNLAKVFVMEAGNTLLENGIKLWYSQKTIDIKVEETEFGRVYRNTYAIKFDGIDTSEHDAKVRADAKAEMIDEIIEYYKPCNDCCDCLEEDRDYFKKKCEMDKQISYKELVEDLEEM